MQDSVRLPIQAHSLYQHLEYLDSLRGVAILLVLWVHAGIVGGIVGPEMAAHPSWPFFFIGQRGVELFYEVSAFTLFLSMSRSRAEHAPLRNFYLRRLFRIAPVFYVALLAEYMWVGQHHPDQWRYLLAALFINGWSNKAINLPIIGCWSIAVEVMFYLCVPFLFRHVRTLRRALVLFVTSWAVSFVTDKILSTLFPNLAQFFTFLWPVAQAPIFAMGIVAYHVFAIVASWLGAQSPSANQELRKGISALLLITAAILFRSNLGRTNAYLVEGSFCFVALILAGNLYAWPLLFSRPLAWLGKITFSVYLVHFFLIPWLTNLFARWMPPPTSRTLVSACGFLALSATAIPLSWCTWRWIEVPGIALGRHLVRRLERRVDVAPPLPTNAGANSESLQF